MVKGLASVTKKVFNLSGTGEKKKAFLPRKGFTSSGKGGNIRAKEGVSYAHSS